MNAYQIHTPIIGARLFRLALAWSRAAPGTIADRCAVIRDLKGRKTVIQGSRSIRAAHDAVIRAVYDIRAVRSPRARSRDPGYPVGVLRFTHVPLAERFAAFKVSTVRATVSDVYRLDDAGALAVLLTDSPAAVGVRQTEYLDWDFYGKRCQYPKRIISTTICVPSRWMSRVRRSGLAVVDGMVTLDAQALEGAPDGVRLYAAAWMVQGRGYALSCVRGCIAVAGSMAYHGESPEAALRGLRRKLGAAQLTARLADLLARHDITAVVAANPHLLVRISDARAIGACEYGIQSWCHSTGLPYEAGAAPLVDVYAAYRARPITYARSAILHALRRQARALRGV